MGKLFLSEETLCNDYDILTEEDGTIYVVAEHVNKEDALKIIPKI